MHLLSMIVIYEHFNAFVLWYIYAQSGSQHIATFAEFPKMLEIRHTCVAQIYVLNMSTEN